MNTSLRTLIPLVGAALALAACSATPPATPSGASETPVASTQTTPQSDMPTAEAPTSTAQPKPTRPTAVTDMLPEAGVTAIMTALATQPGTVVGLDDGKDDNGVWEVSILPDGASKTVEVKVLNGQVTSTQPDADDDDVLSVQGMTITVEAAIAKAFTILQGTFDSADLEMINGQLTWVIDIDPANMADNNQKVQINALSGEATLVTD